MIAFDVSDKKALNNCTKKLHPKNIAIIFNRSLSANASNIFFKYGDKRETATYVLINQYEFEIIGNNDFCICSFSGKLKKIRSSFKSVKIPRNNNE